MELLINYVIDLIGPFQNKDRLSGYTHKNTKRSSEGTDIFVSSYNSYNPTTTADALALQRPIDLGK